MESLRGREKQTAQQTADMRLAGYLTTKRDPGMIKRILVVLDGSPEAEGVLPYVTAIAGGMRSEVTLMHVIGGSRAVTGPLREQAQQRVYLEQIQTDSERAVQPYLKRQAERLRELGIVAKTAILRGPPPKVILEYGGEDKPDLIAMCTHGRSGPGKVAMGSVAEHLLRNARSPILLARSNPEVSGAVAPVKKIVVPLDTSEMAEAAVPIAQELATGMDLSITLVLALPRLSQLYLGAELVAHPEEILERSEGEANRYLQGVCGRIEREGITTDWKVLLGDPATAIVEYVGESQGNIVSMATRGRSGLGRWVLGSVTNKVAQTSETPVLVVRGARS